MTASSSTLQKSAILLLIALLEVAVRAAEDDVGGDTDGLQLLDGVLHGLRLHLARRRLIEHGGDVDEAAVLPARVGPELADRLQEGQRLDVADRAADLDEDHVAVLAGIAPIAAS